MVWYPISNSSTISTLKFGIWLFLILFTVAYPFIDSGSSGGFIFKLALVVAAAFAGAKYGYEALKRNPYFLRLAMWCFAFMLIGYSTYVTTMIRSNADPAVDMFNVDNPMSLVGYLGREQYGDFPLIYGQVFTASPTEYADGDKNMSRLMASINLRVTTSFLNMRLKT